MLSLECWEYRLVLLLLVSHGFWVTWLWFSCPWGKCFTHTAILQLFPLYLSCQSFVLLLFVKSVLSFVCASWVNSFILGESYQLPTIWQSGLMSVLSPGTPTHFSPPTGISIFMFHWLSNSVSQLSSILPMQSLSHWDLPLHWKSLSFYCFLSTPHIIQSKKIYNFWICIKHFTWFY